METESPNSRTSPSSTDTKRRIILLVLVAAPVLIASILVRLDEFDPAPLPPDGLTRVPTRARKHYDHVLEVMERIGEDELVGPEDLVYDAESRLIYTGCGDGWIKRVDVTESAPEAKVERWVHVGGRPLGLALGADGEVYVAEPSKGLLKVSKDGQVELLTNEADGLKFKLVDGVDVADDGMIYFTDASYKYDFNEHMMDALGGRPHGRLLSFDQTTNTTQVLVCDLYFANGVALSPQQDFLVFCETPMRRCRRYYIKGEKKGLVEKFIDNLPGYPDNIRYAGGLFWIGYPTAKTPFYDALMRSPWMRKVMIIMGKLVKIPNMQKDGGVMSVNVDGEMIALYSDPHLTKVTVGLNVGNYLYYGTLTGSHIGRISLNQLHAS